VSNVAAVGGLIFVCGAVSQHERVKWRSPEPLLWSVERGSNRKCVGRRLCGRLGEADGRYSAACMYLLSGCEVSVAMMPI
jgi:hypothetical protein